MKKLFFSFSKNAMLGIIGVVVSSLFVWNTAKAIRAVGTSSTASSSSSSVSSSSSAVSSSSSVSSQSSSASSSLSSSSLSSSSSSSSSVSSSSSSLSSSSSSLSSSSSSSLSSSPLDRDDDDDDEGMAAWALKWLNGELHKSETAKLHEADHKTKTFKQNQLESIEKHSDKDD